MDEDHAALRAGAVQCVARGNMVVELKVLKVAQLERIDVVTLGQPYLLSVVRPPNPVLSEETVGSDGGTASKSWEADETWPLGNRILILAKTPEGKEDEGTISVLVTLEA